MDKYQAGLGKEAGTTLRLQLTDSPGRVACRGAEICYLDVTDPRSPHTLTVSPSSPGLEWNG